MLTLYDYFRSSAAYRLRIALNIKGVAYAQIPVHLVRDGGEHHKDAYRAINPQGRVPSLALDDGKGHQTVLTQSPAILEWLEERHPEPTLLPGDAEERAKIRAIAALIACDIHPLNNLNVMNYLKDTFNVAQDDVTIWYANWVTRGFEAIEALLPEDGLFAFGDTPTLADIYLVPQVFNARRFNVALDKFPKIVARDATCQKIAAFATAHPTRQPDRE